MGTKNNPSEFDCYEKALPDEPIFVLLGRDKHAPTLIWLWATLRELDGEDPEKVAEARKACVQHIDYLHNGGFPIAGIAQATIAGLLELIRQVNISRPADDPHPTSEQVIRELLTKTTIPASDEKK